jgi:hypothetical protein
MDSIGFSPVWHSLPWGRAAAARDDQSNDTDLAALFQDSGCRHVLASAAYPSLHRQALPASVFRLAAASEIGNQEITDRLHQAVAKLETLASGSEA